MGTINNFNRGGEHLTSLNFCLIPVIWMRLLSLISRVFDERQYRRAYLKQMNELLKDCSENTLAGGVYHTPAIVQPWKSQE